MNKVEVGPRAWRLLWCPKAMAWWACYRPLASLRLGSFVFGVWFGIDTASILWYEFPDDPFATHLITAFTLIAGLWLAFIVLVHCWTWFIKPHQIDPGHYADWLVLPLAGVPIVIISLPWDVLDTIYYVAEIAEILNNPNGTFNDLPSWLVGARSSWIVSWMPTTGWLILMIWAGHYVRKHQKILNKNLCSQCRYDLRATISAGIKQCPECGAKAAPNEDKVETSESLE